MPWLISPCPCDQQVVQCKQLVWHKVAAAHNVSDMATIQKNAKCSVQLFRSLT